jgi:hypothetical protein
MRRPYGPEIDEEIRSFGSRLQAFARDFGVLVTGLGLILWMFAASVTNADMRSVPSNLIVLVLAAVLAGLSLFITWGDGGSRVRNSAKSLAVLLGFVVVFVALMIWAAHSSPGRT